MPVWALGVGIGGAGAPCSWRGAARGQRSTLPKQSAVFRGRATWRVFAAAVHFHFGPDRVQPLVRDRVRALPTVVSGLLLGGLVGRLCFVSSDTPPHIYFQF